MKRLNEIAVDEAAVARLVEGSRAPAPARVLGTIAIVSAGTLAVIVLLPALLGGGLWPGLDTLARRLVVGIAASLVLSAWTVSRMLGSYYGGSTPAEAAERIRQEWSRLESPGWRLRFLGVGVALGVTVGLPVGLVLAFGSPATGLPGGSRTVAVLAFVGLTLVWTVPAAYLIRVVSRRSLRPYIRYPVQEETP